MDNGRPPRRHNKKTQPPDGQENGNAKKDNRKQPPKRRPTQQHGQKNAAARRGLKNDNQRSNAGNDEGPRRNINTRDKKFNESTSEHAKRNRSLGFRTLEDLLKLDPDDLIMKITDSRSGLTEALKTDMSPDYIVLMLRLIRKICESPFAESKMKLLHKIFNSNYLSRLIDYVNRLYVQDSEIQKKNKYFWEGNNMDVFWCNIIFICKEVIHLSQNFASEKLLTLITVVHTMIPIIDEKHSISISDEIKEQIADLKSKIDLIADEVKTRREINKNDDKYEEPPPNDFHDIPVYPDVAELLSKEMNYLRENKIKGPYKSNDDYLDVQYRLLREDFVAPLRNGIQFLLHSKNEQKKFSDDIKVYKNVWFLSPEVINHQDCYRISFKIPGKKPIIYEHSKRFMYGSLVCFTNDQFKHILFGKIAERDIKALQMGQVVVGFEEGQNIQINYEVPYTMIECKIYFEPYYHVLSVLKTLRVDDFPMEKYIVRVETDSKPPSYLTLDTTYTIEEHPLQPLDLNAYRNFYNLNPSQEIAFKSALTQELAVIQGPPGTGKTFLGLKIARVLLENSGCWFKKTPMLVICYTNHALDQFLEGLLPVTSRIIRVGGQSKNQALANLNLREKQKRNCAVFGQIRFEVRNYLERIKSITNAINEIDQYKSIVDFTCFNRIIPNYQTSWFATASTQEKLEWLLGSGREGDVRVGNDRPVRDGNDRPVRDGNEREGDIENDGENFNRNNGNMEFGDGKENGDEDDDIFDNIKVQRHSTLFDIDKIERMRTIMCTETERLIAEIETNKGLSYYEYYTKRTELHKLNRDIGKYTTQLRIVKKRLGWQAKEGQLRTFYRYDEADVLNISFDARWQLYFAWLGIYRKHRIREYEEAKKEFDSAYKQHNELREMENVRVMKEALVVGMTTTGAARLRCSLQALQSPIVIVEEAAEVLESHIVAALTPQCKHLILIGDHKQLKPSTANFKIEKTFKLGISLFERMILNNIQYYTLNVQHRMRPEISKLVSPMIYPDLRDHESVHHRPRILGVEKPLFFIDHDKLEESCEDESKKNIHEADFLIYLARHLILNGYKPEDITILAAYLGQMYAMKKAKGEHGLLLKDVRIAVLDNYQGEECEIILLSLVRSNSENKIGFLDIENRVCVALSRARTGFYIMGNMTHLCNSSKSGIWPKVKQTLEDQDAIGTSLLLRCQVHPDTVTKVSSQEDFFPISEGGCSQLCNLKLACGHKCASICHAINRDHDKYKCKEVCGKKCESYEHHICQKMCFEECGLCGYLVKRTLKCGHTRYLKCHIDPDVAKCDEEVFAKLPCGHETNKPCYCKPEEFRCPFRCEYIVESCGHACERTCHIFNDPDHIQYKCMKQCAKYRAGCTTEIEEHLCTNLCHEECLKCNIPVVKKLTKCSHSLKVACSVNVDDFVCRKKCVRAMSCGHFCKNLCHAPCGPCKVLVEKPIQGCGHIVSVLCEDEPKPELCTKKCERKLACGHNCLKNCKEECMSILDCKKLVKCDEIRSPCGHYITEIECGLYSSGIKDNDDRLAKFCKHPCDTTLKCGHLCPGSCGGCHQGKLHKKCIAPCGAIQICNHECPNPCRKACKPCAKSCSYGCEHSKCGKRCGEPCTPCKEQCKRKCVHQKCNRRCHQVCSIKPCSEPCELKLKKCGHPCIGFCGETCPPLCRLCNPKEIETVLLTFSPEDEENARFVYLEDCGHVVESDGMEKCFKLKSEKIGFTKCPFCRKPIFKTKYYSDYVKITLEDVSNIKKKLSGTRKENESLREELLKRVNGLGELSGNIPRIYQNLLKFKQRLVPVNKNRRQYINKTELNGIKSKLDVIENIVTIMKTEGVNVSSYAEQVDFLMDPMTVAVDQELSEQEISDLKFELNRLLCLVQFDKLKHILPLESHSQDIQNSYSAAQGLIFTLGQFDKAKEVKVKKSLKFLRESLKIAPLSMAELKEIAMAMGPALGHWNKCPRGHYYYIGNCGGAMEVGRCNECNARIGGQNHQLLASNQHTGDLDGSSYSAWSEQANMNNYDLRFL